MWFSEADRESKPTFESLLQHPPQKTPRERKPEMPWQNKVNGWLRYQPYRDTQFDRVNLGGTVRSLSPQLLGESFVLTRVFVG